MQKRKPYYAKATKEKVVFEYENTSASASELPRLHGILGSNTVADWVRKYGNLHRTKPANIIVKAVSDDGLMSINRACRLLGYSKQAYFKAFKNKKAKDERTAIATEFILKHVKTIRKDMPKIGGLKLFYLIGPLLKGAGIKTGRDGFMDMLGRHNLLVVRKKRRYTTTDSSHWMNQYDNLIEGVVPSTKLLKKNKIGISMTQDGSPYDNAVAERINGILKDEFLLGGLLKNIDHAKELTARAVGIYNGMEATLEQPPADTGTDAPAGQN